jgi:hypothetical protein
VKSIISVITFTIVSTLLLAIGIVVFGNPDSVLDTVNDERHMLSDNMGSAAVLEVIQRTDHRFRSMTPAVESSLSFFAEEGNLDKIDHPNILASANNLRLWYMRAVEVFWNLVYQSLQRIYALLQLAPLALCLIVPSFIDGLVVRQIRISSFGYTSPLFYQLSFIALAAIFTGLLLIATVPTALPFWVFVTWALSLAWFVRSIASNTQKKL